MLGSSVSTAIPFSSAIFSEPIAAGGPQMLPAEVLRPTSARTSLPARCASPHARARARLGTWTSRRRTHRRSAARAPRKTHSALPARVRIACAPMLRQGLGRAQQGLWSLRTPAQLSSSSRLCRDNHAAAAAPAGDFETVVGLELHVQARGASLGTVFSPCILFLPCYISRRFSI